MIHSIYIITELPIPVPPSYKIIIKHNSFFHFPPLSPVAFATKVFILTICFLLVFQIWWGIRCQSVFLSMCPVYSCLPPRTVSFPHWRRGEFLKKSSTPVLNLSKPLPIIVSSTPLSAPFVCPPAWLCCPPGLWSSSYHTSQIILVWLLPAGH